MGFKDVWEAGSPPRRKRRYYDASYASHPKESTSSRILKAIKTPYLGNLPPEGVVEPHALTASASPQTPPPHIYNKKQKGEWDGGGEGGGGWLFSSNRSG